MRQKLLNSKVELIQAFTANMIAFEERTPDADKATERPTFILQQVNGMLDTFISFFAPVDETPKGTVWNSNPVYVGEKRLTEKQALGVLNTALENGWKPAHVRDMSCLCHMNPPCSKCCLDGDYLDEFCEENGIEIIPE